jgi:abortive infection bacteriophage resistance protein
MNRICFFKIDTDSSLTQIYCFTGATTDIYKPLDTKIIDENIFAMIVFDKKANKILFNIIDFSETVIKSRMTSLYFPINVKPAFSKIL